MYQVLLIQNVFSPITIILYIRKKPHNINNYTKNPTLEGADSSQPNLNILSLNCCSIRSQEKRGMLQSIIFEHNIDIIIGCESHLDNSYSSTEIFPPNFTVFRKDRAYGGGGVFLAFLNDLPIIEQPLLVNEAEMIWCKFCPPKGKPIYLGSFYRPPDSRSDPLLSLKESLYKIQNIDSSFQIVLAGDFNFPDISWKNGSDHVRAGPTYGCEVNYTFLDILNDFGLELSHKE